MVLQLIQPLANGIANLLSLPQMEADCFMLCYHTGGNWIATTSQGKEITFHREKNGVCCGFPYIDMQSTDAVAMIRTAWQQYEGLIKCKVQNATSVRKAQAMTGHHQRLIPQIGEKQLYQKLPGQTWPHH
jgi:hypothetical protein